MLGLDIITTPTTDDLYRHAATVETLLKPVLVSAQVDSVEYPSEFNYPVPAVDTSPIMFRERPVEPQKRGVVILTSMEVPDRMLWACVTAVVWNVYQGCDVEVIVVGAGTDLTAKMLPAMKHFLETEANAKVTVVKEFPGKPGSVSDRVFFPALRLFHHHYTSFSPDTVVHAADTDMIPLHKYAFRERLPSSCVWSHIYAGEHNPVQAKKSQPKFAFGDTILETGRSTALPPCPNENDPGKFVKETQQCYKGVVQLAFFSNSATQEHWKTLFPARSADADFVNDVVAAIQGIADGVEKQNAALATGTKSDFEFTRVGFTDQALLTKQLVDYELTRDPVKDPRACVTNYRLYGTLGTLYPFSIKHMDEWRKASTEQRDNYYIYHHMFHRAATSDAEWTFINAILHHVLPQDYIDELNAIRVDVFDVGKH